MAEFIEKIAQTPGLKAVFNYENFRLQPAFDAKAQAAFIRPNEKLDNAFKNSLAKGLPPISVLPMAAQHLSVLTRLVGAKSVLEIGTLGGYSSIVFAQAGAKVTSIEISPKHRDVALENVSGLDVEILLGAALDVLPKLAEEGRKFDLVFIDADFDDQWEHFDWAVKLSRSGGGIFLDDVVPTMIKNGEVGFGGGGEVVEKRSVMERIGEDARVKASFLPVVAHMQPVLPDPMMNGFILAVVE
ncbi:S-adenosyl-L-methionine-dependent methyltransferase [Karstenula rhodostoma CBS 690.94]|uniref:S-adenosyl-L-methionine-dependent methyltransferase n=1 Tax=Karstenula rhodostoma CBS 690.94 TaxID=1392251 RepID=A0A9P4UBN6_9PLEO|nr:S-adenosyl-L-methionine-dependent methyltransferase [Karstenula rhodostoma CBS 690.94]